MVRSVDSLKAFVAGSAGDASHRLLPGVIVVGAGKGGVGTSTLAGLMALHAARKGASVLLVDADETVGSLHLLFGLPDDVPGLGSLRRGTTTPEALVQQAAPGLALFPGGGGGVDSTLAVAAAERRTLLRRVSGLYEHYDIVVVDGGSRLDSVMAACAVGSERLLCVTTGDRIAQAGAYALLKVARGRFGDLPVELLVNGSSDQVGREVHRVVEAAAGSFLATGIPFGGAVVEDSELRQHLSMGGSLIDGDPEAPAFVSCGAVIERILHEQESRASAPVPVIPLHGGARALR